MKGSTVVRDSRFLAKAEKVDWKNTDFLAKSLPAGVAEYVKDNLGSIRVEKRFAVVQVTKKLLLKLDEKN